MAVSYNYEPGFIDIAMSLKEGNMTYNDEAEGDFGTIESWTFASPLKKGDYVKLDTTTSKKVIKASSGDTIIGQIISKPEWSTEQKSRYKESKTEGNYTPRKATVRLFCNWIREVKLATNNSAINPGDSIEYKGDATFDKKASGTNKTVCLDKVSALAGGNVTVAFGCYNDF